MFTNIKGKTTKIVDIVLPDIKISINKCSGFYKADVALEISRKNRLVISRFYISNTIILFLGLFVGIYECINGNKGIFDLLAIMTLITLIFIMIFKMRYSSIERMIRQNKISIVEDLPKLTDTLVLLLNAGMFLEAAIIKITHDYKNEQDRSENSILLDNIFSLIERSRESNSSLIHELSVYAVKTGVRELIRFTSIVENNYNKGSELVEKLESEGMLLWMRKKKSAEEKAKMAGTKLSLPLMLLLISLILITSAPMLLSI